MEHECCRGNNVFALSRIEFKQVRPLVVYAVGLRWTNASRNGCDVAGVSPGVVQRPRSPLTDCFELLRTWWPGRVTVADTGREFNVSREVLAGCRDSDVSTGALINNRLFAAYEDLAPPAKVVGLNPTAFSGGSGPGPVAVAGSNVATADRTADEIMMQIVAHETGHTIGLAHPPEAGDATACSTEAGDRLGGVGLDPRLGSGGATGTFAVIADGWDYMSKACGDWVSAPYWASTVRELRPGGRLHVGWTRYFTCCFLGGAADPTVRSASAREAGPTEPRHTTAGLRSAPAVTQPIVRVSAVLGTNKSVITRVLPDTGTPDAPAPGSHVVVVVRNRSGAEVSRTPIRAQALREPGSPEARAVNARVPGRGAARVEIHDGTAIATAEATRHAPTATITSPSRGATIGGHGRFTVRWRAGDADGDPVQTTVQFSSDGGRRWQTLAADVHGTKVRLRRAALPRTRRGVLRVIVSDGFNVARSSARRLHTEGGRPQVDITFPAAKHAAAPADATVVLESSAVDLAGRPLSGRRLVWRSRGNRIGRGLQIAVPAYRLGRTVTVTGRDRAGARGRDTVRMRIRKVAPEFTTLRGARLAKTAGRLRLRLASTLPATVTARGPGLRRTTARLGGAARVIEVKIKAGALNRHSYRIALTLAASGKTTRQTLRIRRR